MGTYLSTPVTEKESEDGGKDGVLYGTSAMQGWRVKMEDAHLARVYLEPQDKLSLFAVFDGHGGPEVAAFCAAHLSEVLLESEAFKRKDLERALAEAFLKLDKLLEGEAGQKELIEIVRQGKENSRRTEPDVSIEDVVEQTGLTAVSIRKYVLEAWKKRSGKGETEEGQQGGHASIWKLATVNGEMVEVEDEEEEGEEERKGKSPSEEGGSTSEGKGGEQMEEGDEQEIEQGDGAAPASKSEEAKKEAPAGGGSSSNGEQGGHQEEEDEDEEEEEDEMEDEIDEDSTEEAIRSINFHRVKDHLLRLKPGFDSGTTANVVLLCGRESLIVANAGDSRCVLSRDGKAVEMSRDHKPEDKDELERIQGAGGTVQEGRVEGNLNLSRAIGDLNYKQEKSLPPEKQMISANPEIRTIALSETDEFFVVACDGIWNVMTSQQVVDYVRERIQQRIRLSKICEEICDKCCDEEMNDASDGSGCDNMTVMIVMLPGGKRGGGGPAAVNGIRMDVEHAKEKVISPPAAARGGGGSGASSSTAKKPLEADGEALSRSGSSKDSPPRKFLKTSA